MNFSLDYSMPLSYKSQAQRMRVITETWVTLNSYCPICGNETINHYNANRPVADFWCPCCQADFELKSKNEKIDRIPPKIADGAYETMISRISSNHNPHFLFLIHNAEIIQHYFLIPNYWFVPAYIEKRPPLPSTARRAGWIGCNIDLSNIPNMGKIYIIKNQHIQPKENVIENFRRAEQLHDNSIDRRSWILDVLKCIEEIPNCDFTLNNIYTFTEQLQYLHPQNRNIKAKIRQQLQLLRNKGIIKFLGKGRYQKQRQQYET